MISLLIIFVLVFIAVIIILSPKHGYTSFLITFSLFWFVHIPTGEQLFLFNLTFFDVFLIFAVFRKLLKRVPKKSYSIKYILRCYYVLIFIGLVSLLLFSDDLKFGFYFFRSSLILPTLILLLFINYIDNLNKFNLVYKYFNFGVLLFSIFLLSNYLFDGFIGSNDYSLNRLGGTPNFPFGHWGYIGSVQIASLYSCIFAFFIPYWLPNITKNLISMTNLFFVLLTIFLAGSRGAYIAIILVTIFYFIKNINFKLFFTISAIIGILLTITSNFNEEKNQSERFETLSALDKDNSFLYRIQMIQLGYETLKNQPQGIGFGRENRITNNEHNIYAFIGLGTGLIGLIIYLYSLFLISKAIKITQKFTCTEKEKQILNGGKLVISAMLINGLSDSIIMESFQSIGIYICFGFILSLCNYKIITNKIIIS